MQNNLNMFYWKRMAYNKIKIILLQFITSYQYICTALKSGFLKQYINF